MAATHMQKHIQSHSPNTASRQSEHVVVSDGPPSLLGSVKVALTIVFICAVAAPLLIFNATENFILYIYTQAKLIPITMLDGKRYARVTDLLSALGPANVIDKSDSFLQVKVGRNTLTFRPNSTLCIVNGSMLSLNDPTILLSGTWMIPLDAISKLYPRLTERNVTYRPHAPRAFVSTQPPPTLFFEASKGILSSRIALEVSQTTPFELKRDGQQVIVTLGSRPLNPFSEKLNYSDELIQSVAFDDLDFKPKLRVALTSAPTDVKASVTQDGRILIATISRVQPTPPAARKTLSALPPGGMAQSVKRSLGRIAPAIFNKYLLLISSAAGESILPVS